MKLWRKSSSVFIDDEMGTYVQFLDGPRTPPALTRSPHPALALRRLGRTPPPHHPRSQCPNHPRHPQPPQPPFPALGSAFPRTSSPRERHSPPPAHRHPRPQSTAYPSGSSPRQTLPDARVSVCRRRGTAAAALWVPWPGQTRPGSRGGPRPAGARARSRATNCGYEISGGSWRDETPVGRFWAARHRTETRLDCRWTVAGKGRRAEWPGWSDRCRRLWKSAGECRIWRRTLVYWSGVCGSTRRWEFSVPTESACWKCWWNLVPGQWRVCPAVWGSWIGRIGWGAWRGAGKLWEEASAAGLFSIALAVSEILNTKKKERRTVGHFASRSEYFYVASLFSSLEKFDKKPKFSQWFKIFQVFSWRAMVRNQSHLNIFFFLFFFFLINFPRGWFFFRSYVEFQRKHPPFETIRILIQQKIWTKK